VYQISFSLLGSFFSLPAEEKLAWGWRGCKGLNGKAAHSHGRDGMLLESDLMFGSQLREWRTGAPHDGSASS
jgi:hypothetical protein